MSRAVAAMLEKEKRWTSPSPKRFQGKKLKLGARQVLPLGKKCDFFVVVDDFIGGFMMTS